MTYMSIGKWEVQEKAFCFEYQEYEVTDKSRETAPVKQLNEEFRLSTPPYKIFRT
jgi:hypothetical protein